jgi:hypothetical protein
MLFKSFCLATKVVVATATQSEKIAEEVQAFIEGVAQKISNKIVDMDQNDPNKVRAMIGDAVEKSGSLSPEAKKSIGDFLQKKNPPLPIIAAYVFDSEDEVLQSSEIVKRAVERYGKNQSSVLPSDYAGTKYSPVATLEKVDRGRYCLSPDGKAAWVARDM